MEGTQASNQAPINIDMYEQMQLLCLTKPSQLVQAGTVVTCILDMRRSNLGPDTYYHERFSSVPRHKCRDNTLH
jgi:hypothetical protein